MTRRGQKEFEGYCEGDITYCVDPANDDFFPVCVIRTGRAFVDVGSFNSELTVHVAPEFNAEKKNRRFMRPKLSRNARFGGYDERTVNAERASAQELRLLPYDYRTYTCDKIKSRNAENPELWPMPTGIVYERYFKEATT